MDASHSSTIRLSVKEKYFDFFFLKSGERGDVSRRGGGAGMVEVSQAVTMPAHLEKKEKKEHWERSCAADLPFEKSGGIISIQMTALCRSIHNQS